MHETPPPQPAPDERPELFLTKDRAKRFAFRLEGIAKERSLHFAGARVGMASFAEAVPALREVEADLSASIAAILAGRLRDRERGETEIPLVVVLERTLEQVGWARTIEERRRARRVPTEWAERRLGALLSDAARRLDAFARFYDEKRLVPVPVATDLAHVLLRVEEDAACARLPAVATEPPGLRGRPVDRLAPPFPSAADPLEDFLRAARAELPDARPPWRLERASPTAPVVLALGAEVGTEGAAGAEALGGMGAPAAERTERARAVLRLVQPATVARARDAEGRTVGLRITLADRAAEVVGARVRPDVALAPAVDGAVRAYLAAAAKAPDDLLAPGRLVGVLGVLRAVDAELARVLGPALSGSAAPIAASRVPRESSRKAPVRREVLAAVAETVPGFPVQRVSEVLDAIGAGKPGRDATKPPDAAVVLAFLGRRWPKASGFGERVLPIGPWSDEDVLAAVGDVVELAAIRTALERSHDPGPGWDARFERAAFRLLGRLATTP